MKNIIIVGNGFDLAHNLPTSYSLFIDNLILTEFKKENSDIIHPFVSKSIGEIANKKLNERKVKYISINRDKYSFTTGNIFLADLIQEKEKNKKNWSDIEAFYYNALLKTNENSLNALQIDFEIIKQRLIIYLNSISKESKVNNNFNYFFNHNYFKTGEIQNNLILNFNYTNTLEQLYKNNLKEFKIENVHGQLSDFDDDYIVFGHDMSIETYKKYLDIKDEEFFKNIKFIKYRLNSKFEKLNLFLSDETLFNVFIIGHSCSVSDNQMLKNIFESKYLNQVSIFYYKEDKNYLSQRRNIDIIMKDTNVDIDSKIKSIPSNCQIPLYDDDSLISGMFKSKIDEILTSDLFREKRLYHF